MKRVALLAAAVGILVLAAWLVQGRLTSEAAPEAAPAVVTRSTPRDALTQVESPAVDQVVGELWLDATTRAPAGVEVHLSVQETWDDSQPISVQVALTRAHGVFGFPQAAAGTYVLWSRPAGHAPAVASVVVKGGPAAPRRLECGPGIQVTGTVTDQDSKERLSGVELLGTSQGLPFEWRARTNARGEFELEGVPAHTPFTLRAQDEHHLDWEDVFTPQDVDIELQPGAVVHGDVTLDGTLMPGVEVVLWNTTHRVRRAKRAITDVQGHYAFRSVGVGQVDVRAEWKQYAGNGQVSTVAGTRARVDLDLVARFPVQVEVQSGWGEVLPGARVALGYCIRPSGKTIATQNTEVVTDDTGHAVLWMDDRGTCVLNFEHEDHGGESTRAVMAPNVPVTLKFAKSVVLRGRVTTPEGRGVAAVVMLDCEANDHATVTAHDDGRFVVRQLGAGACEVTVNAEGWSTKKVQVVLSMDRSAAWLNVVVDDRGLTLAGRVVNPDGKGVQADVRLVESADEGLRYFSAQATADGHFTLTGLRRCPTCSHVITASHQATEEVRSDVTLDSPDLVLVMPALALDAGP